MYSSKQVTSATYLNKSNTATTKADPFKSVNKGSNSSKITDDAQYPIRDPPINNDTVMTNEAVDALLEFVRKQRNQRGFQMR